MLCRSKFCKFQHGLVASAEPSGGAVGLLVEPSGSPAGHHPASPTSLAILRRCMVKALSILPLVQGLGQGFVTPKQCHLQSLCLSIGTLSLSLVWLMQMGMLVDFQRLSTGVIRVQEVLYDWIVVEKDKTKNYTNNLPKYCIFKKYYLQKKDLKMFLLNKIMKTLQLVWRGNSNTSW